jgi:BirA family transcriptional regulator, biotin operon repressor / biotin---[acetyl-CoA-carboxylase] ligase
MKKKPETVPASKISLKEIEKHIAKENVERINKIEIFDNIDSTNNYLLQLSASNDDIRICLAEQQTAGKGRLGRSWFSPPRANIYLSISFPFSKEANELSGLSLAVATVVADVLAEIGVEQGVGLKWPNDVLWEYGVCPNNRKPQGFVTESRYKKLVGILVETASGQHGVNNAVIGIGLNVNMPKDAAKVIDQPWVDLQTIMGHVVDRSEVAGLLVDRLIEKLFVFQNSGLSVFLKRWRQLDVWIGKPVKITTPLGDIKGVARGIDENGCFLLDDKKGVRHTISSGEILTICKKGTSLFS